MPATRISRKPTHQLSIYKSFFHLRNQRHFQQQSPVVMKCNHLLSWAFLLVASGPLLAHPITDSAEMPYQGPGVRAGLLPRGMKRERINQLNEAKPKETGQYGDSFITEMTELMGDKMETKIIGG
ncbi:hypothetical protein EYF80_014946 [Liparis tanakae]|uniref:Uncharacterized protein n=1 Tax=Liparis tanakae TaxID=230148 RepID=A0A4Z2I9Y7_9TELE|nr:hypothetical protein EYF80_014946 [Liparis tanakae]